MSFSKKFRDKSPIKQDDDGNPVTDFIKKGVKTLAFGPIGDALSLGTDFVKSQIAKNIRPRGYQDALGRVSKAVVGIPEPGSINYSKGYTPNANKERQDLLSLMMTGESPNNSIQVSKYKPTKSKDPNATYYSSPTTENFLKRKILESKKYTNRQFKGGTDYFGDSSLDNVLGNYTINKGIDKDGKEYFSYYDVWDLNPFKDGIKDKLATTAQEVVGVKPAEVYGRVYVDEVVEETWQDKMENRNNKD